MRSAIWRRRIWCVSEEANFGGSGGNRVETKVSSRVAPIELSDEDDDEADEELEQELDVDGERFARFDASWLNV